MSLLRKFFGIPIIAKFLKFGVVGASGMVVDYGFLIVFKELLGWPEWISIALAFILAATSNYLFNRYWTFKSHNKQIGREYVNFIEVSLVGLLITEVTMFLFGEFEWTQHVIGDSFHDKVYFYINKFIAIVITTLWNFFGNLLITFRQRKEPATAGNVAAEPVKASDDATDNAVEAPAAVAEASEQQA